MLVYPSGVDVSSSALRFLSARLRQHRRELGTRSRRLSPGRQALLTLAYLRNGHPYAQLAAGFGIGTTTAYRYVAEAVELLATLAPTLAEAARTASTKAFVLLDGTLLPIDRIAADRPFYSGKHKKHGMNVQVLADPPAGCCGRHRLCPEPSTISGPPVNTASSPLLQRPASPAGPTRATEVPRLRSASRTGADGRSFPQARRPSTGPREDPSPGRAGRRHTQVLATPPQDPLLDQPRYRPRPSRPLPASGQLRLRMENAHGLPAGTIPCGLSVAGLVMAAVGCVVSSVRSLGLWWLSLSVCAG